MKLSAAKKLLQDVQERDKEASNTNFMAAKAQLEHSDAARLYKEYLRADYALLSTHESELMDFLGMPPIVREANPDITNIVNELTRLYKLERALYTDLVDSIDAFRTARTTKQLDGLVSLKDHPANSFYLQRVLSVAEYHNFDLQMQNISYEASELISLLTSTGKTIRLCPGTFAKISHFAQSGDDGATTAAPKVSPAAYRLASFLRPFAARMPSKSTQSNIQNLKKAHTALAKVFGTRVDSKTGSTSSVKSRLIVPLSSVQEAIQSEDGYVTLVDTINTRFNHLRKTLQRTAAFLEQESIDEEQVSQNFDAYLARLVELYEESKAAAANASKVATSNKSAPRGQLAICPNPADAQRIAKMLRDVEKAKQVARYKASKETAQVKQERDAQLADRMERGAADDLASYRAKIVMLRGKLIDQEKKRHVEMLFQYEQEERKRREAAEADAAAVRPNVERSKERVLAPTAALIARREANKLRAQFLANEGQSRIFQTNLAIDGELVTMAGKSGMVHDNQENAVSTIATELMAQYGILGTDYARAALAELRNQEISQRFHHYSIRDTVAGLFM